MTAAASVARQGYRPTWAEIDLDRIASNLASLRSLAGRETLVLPVIKANAYGHGASAVARRLEAEGVAGVCVALPEEGVELRRAGISVPILCLGAVDEAQIAAAARSRITLSLYSPEQLEVFERTGRSANVPVRFHLKLETGMNRLGLMIEELGPLLEKMRHCRAAVLAGLFSNLACADQPAEPFNAQQGEKLASAAAIIRAAGHDPRPVHLANSAGLLYHPALRFDAVRPGLLVYGVRPVPGDDGASFAPALSLKSTVLRVKTIPAGSAVGYGGAFRTERESVLATLAIGYDDGLPRALSGKGDVLIGGKRAPIVGAISMDLTVADVTECGAVRPGDEAVIIGSQGDQAIGVWEVAQRAGTIAWEVLCGLGRRVPRLHRTAQGVVSATAALPEVKEVPPPEPAPAAKGAEPAREKTAASDDEGQSQQGES